MADHREKPKGCWTCRLRRKKCDGLRPVCGICATLNITCHNSDVKPDWMDGAGKQTEMAEIVKAQIKAGADSRRDRQKTYDALGRSLDDGGFVVTSAQDYGFRPVGEKRSGNQLTPETPTATPEGSKQHLRNRYNHEGGAQEEAMSTSTSGEQLPSLSSKFETPQLSTNGASPIGNEFDLAVFSFGQEWEMNFLMLYMDEVFPFLFPYYKPPIFESGRAWLLSFLRNNKSVLHSAITLTSYFTVVGADSDVLEHHEDCKSLILDNAFKQAHISSETLQQELNTINSHDAALAKKSHVIGSMVHLLAFDIFLGRQVDWDAQLTTGVRAFEDLLNSQNTSPDRSLPRILESLGSLEGFHPNLAYHIWHPDQSALYFFAALLLYMDILASTSLERPPRLHTYHANIFAASNPQQGDVLIDFFTVFGCQNSVLLAVGDIAALDSWKKEQKQRGSLSVPELVQRADKIYQVLAQGFQIFVTKTRPLRADTDDHVGLWPFYDRTRPEDPGHGEDTCTRIWAHAARIYLAVVVSGWQPSNMEVREDVAQVAALLRTVPSGTKIRAMAWPLCIAGCLAETREQRQEFQDIISQLGDLTNMTAIRDVSSILERVWSIETVGSESRDLGACLRILSRPVLLI